MNTYSSSLLETAVDELAKLPGIGRKTALRLALHLLRQDEVAVENFGKTIIKLRKEIKFCKHCHNISDEEICEICSDPKRDKGLLCVVEDVRDVLAIENTNQYKGLYHVLNGIISPMEGISAADLTMDSLVKKVFKGNIDEVILALPTTIEGDTTNYYIFKQLQSANISITTIARGIAIGDELEYTDEVTLGRSILNRTPFKDAEK